MSANEETPHTVSEVSDYTRFYALCTDTHDPLSDEEIELVQRMMPPSTPRQSIVQVLQEDIVRKMPVAKSEAQAESMAVGSIIAVQLHVAALAPRLLATIAMLKKQDS